MAWRLLSSSDTADTAGFSIFTALAREKLCVSQGLRECGASSVPSQAATQRGISALGELRVDVTLARPGTLMDLQEITRSTGWSKRSTRASLGPTSSSPTRSHRS